MACINLYKMNFNKVDDFLDDLKSSNYLAKPNKKIDKDTCEFKFTLYLCEAKQSNDEISWNWLLNEFDESPLYVYKSPRAILFIDVMKEKIYMRLHSVVHFLKSISIVIEILALSLRLVWNILILKRPL